MEWSDEGVILGVRRHGENSVIVEAMTADHGRHLGLVRSGRSARMRPILQPGNSVTLTWRARLEDHLGQFAVEAASLRAATLMEGTVGLYGLQVLAAHLRLLPERDPHLSLYRAALVILDHLDEPQKAARLVIRFELALLEELGFGLDLDRCAATGTAEDLTWVSPRSGKAVSREAGQPWEARLLALPAFLQKGNRRSAGQSSHAEQIIQGFGLSGYFLDRHVWSVRGLKRPDVRDDFVRTVSAALGNAKLEA